MCWCAYINQRYYLLLSRKDKLLDLKISEIVSNKEFEAKYKRLSTELEEKQAELNKPKNLSESHKEIKEKLTKITDQLLMINASSVEQFDKNIFEQYIDKVIVGGYDENNISDPYQLNYILKSGAKILPINNKAIDMKRVFEIERFKMPYKGYMFVTDKDGVRHKKVFTSVNVIISINMATENRLEDDINV